MDRDRFDALARLLATTGSRRATLGAILAAGLLGHDSNAPAKPGKGKRKNRGKSGGDRDKDRKHRKKRESRDQDHDGGQEPEPLTGVCCDDARPCADPEPGSTRAGCDFDERDFSGQDLNGSIFRGMVGRDANFDGTDNHGSVFAAACLRRASFRGANLAGTTWRGACLFGANFTGADLGGDSAVFADAVFCATIMPDGTRNDRDCGRSDAFPCCLPPPGGGGGGGQPCTRPADCPDETCQTKACPNGTCVYTPVTNGPSPNAQCTTTCCNGDCCAGGEVCNRADLCCAPQCGGRQCGPDGCGVGGSCGTCPAGLGCDDGSGRCVCNRNVCFQGCCAGLTCLPGKAHDNCGSGASPCQACPADFVCIPTERGGFCDCTDASCAPFGAGCRNHRCICNAIDCGAIGGRCNQDETECVCDQAICERVKAGCCSNEPGKRSVCLPANSVQTCGKGGTCHACATGELCIDGQCDACSPNCPCVGQSVCTTPRNNPNEPTTVCKTNTTNGETCFCMVSRTGQPICAGELSFVPACETDAECGARLPGSVCVNFVPGSSICGIAGNFCAAPCKL